MQGDSHASSPSSLVHLQEPNVDVLFFPMFIVSQVKETSFKKLFLNLKRLSLLSLCLFIFVLREHYI